MHGFSQHHSSRFYVVLDPITWRLVREGGECSITGIERGSDGWRTGEGVGKDKLGDEIGEAVKVYVNSVKAL